MASDWLFSLDFLVDDWMAIQYDIITTNPETGEAKPGTTMEFARFGDYCELGAKVDEGWGGSRNESYAGMLPHLCGRKTQPDFHKCK